MNLLELNIWRGGFFKEIKHLFSSPQKAQVNHYIGESGTVSKEVIPMHTGFETPLYVKKTWKVIHNLKFQVYKMGVPTGESVLVISDRSYMPLDVNGILKKNEQEKLMSLTDIAKMKHADARADAATNTDERKDIAQIVINNSFLLLGIIALAFLFLRGC